MYILEKSVVFFFKKKPQQTPSIYLYISRNCLIESPSLLENIIFVTIYLITLLKCIESSVYNITK